MTARLTVPLHGKGFRVLSGDEDGVHDWKDLLLPRGDYQVEAVFSDGYLAAVSLTGPIVRESLAQREELLWAFPRSFFCFVRPEPGFVD
jgi:hypothetical protein